MKTILSLNNEEAKAFFLKNESYCNFDLPEYFTFEGLLMDLSKELKSKSITDFYKEKIKPKHFDNVNHVIVGNKDGKYAWRSFELINPALYVGLVHKITVEEHWNFIKKHLRKQLSDKITCSSLPRISTNKKKMDRAEQILNWWHKIEQQSLELSLEYDHIIDADIATCYDSIYTHSIPWALHGIETVKNKPVDNKLLGNIIDKSIRDMRYGQTNGIPTGSVLMDFVAEIVLAGIDKLLSAKLDSENIKEYKILRYRDDYRIFINDSFVGTKILKCLSEVLYQYNFKINYNKTKKKNNVILNSIKDDKIAMLGMNKNYSNIQKELLAIYKFSTAFPNSGSLVKLLNEIYEKIKENSETIKKENINVVSSIVVQIMFENPRAIPVGAGLLSLFFQHASNFETIISKVVNKFSKIPNTGFLDIWLQRLSIKRLQEQNFREPLCKLMSEKVDIWNIEWLAGTSKIKELMKNTSIIDKNILDKMDNVIAKEEFNIFAYMD